MIVSLWDGCAQYAEIEVGDHLEVRHARLKDNTFHQQKVAYVDYLNQIVVSLQLVIHMMNELIGDQ